MENTSLVVPTSPNERQQPVAQLLREAWDLRLQDPARSLAMSLEGNRLAREATYPVGLAYSYRNVGFSLMLKGDHENAQKHLTMALRMFVKIRDRIGEASTQLVLGYCYQRMGEFSETVTALSRAHGIFESAGHRLGLAYAEHAFGNLSAEMGTVDQALKHFQTAEAMFNHLAHPVGEAYALDGIGVVYRLRGSFGRALEFHLRALQLFEQLSLPLCQAQVLNHLGYVHHQLENYEDALKHFHSSTQLADQTEERYLEQANLLEIGHLLLDLGSTDEAFIVLFKALHLAKEIRARARLYQVHFWLSEAYALQNNFEKAYEHHREYHDLRESVVNDEARARLRNQQISFATDKSKAEAEIYRLRNIELAAKNRELERALEVTNDSIDYARRIQEAMLPGERTLQAHLPDSFIYFKPRDVVSGDFYWITEWNDRIILAAVDCTGHGVPGAFMSVLGQSLLNQVVKENYNFIPGKILQALDQRLIEELGQGGSEIHDGMEAAIVTISLEDYTLQYAGANIPLYLVNPNGLTCVPAKHAALGGFRRPGETKEFHTHILQLQRGDTIYLFSDGFRDQFGLDDDSKVKYSTKRFQRLLEQMFVEPMPRQKEILHQEFEAWRGKLKQLDDVMVIGVRF